ncbi:MAG TPA: phosphohistidine phosphatase SixA [Rubrobacteraceae bacterium]|nr:phosphohistidine phosphatase SixA [Rubrobacteraceae bacterium]
MKLYIVRHAAAYKRNADLWPDDSRRPLTPEGEERFRRAAEDILRLVPEVDLVLTSPFARAWRTAEILERQGWPAPVPCEELEPDYPPHKVVGALADQAEAGSVAVVGHRPGLHELVSYLLTGDAESADIQLKKGGIVRLQLEGYPEPGSASLRWLLTPKILRAVCAEPPRDSEG